MRPVLVFKWDVVFVIEASKEEDELPVIKEKDGSERNDILELLEIEVLTLSLIKILVAQTAKVAREDVKKEGKSEL